MVHKWSAVVSGSQGGTITLATLSISDWHINGKVKEKLSLCLSN
jgi:hypothetical protein